MGVGDLGAVLQALGNLWGLSFAIMTMGYGLVEIPRYFWWRSSLQKRVEFLYFKCYEHAECRDAARDRVDELLYLWKKAKLTQSAPHSALYQTEIGFESLTVISTHFMLKQAQSATKLHIKSLSMI